LNKAEKRKGIFKMTVKTVTNWETLIKLAHALGKARMDGNLEQIEKAQKDYYEYAALARQLNEVII